MKDTKTLAGWYGDNHYVGLHSDLHAHHMDENMGAGLDVDTLRELLEKSGCQWAQTDTKGHPGYTTFFSRVPGAIVCPGLKKDVPMTWREATRQLNMPLHYHYSGIWDCAAGEHHPDWCIVGPDGNPVPPPHAGLTRHGADAKTRELMCVRSPYLEELMLPQLYELIDRYDADGFWIDGDVWGIRHCYCPRCTAAFQAETGQNPPTDPQDPAWERWVRFTMDSLKAYVTRYCDAIHAKKPDARVCSNWLQTFGSPGKPDVPTDWISGDNVPPFSLDKGRCEARFISTRGKHWDVMIWAWYNSHGFLNPQSPSNYKPVEMIYQEAAIYQAFGGAVQLCISPLFQEPRSAQTIPWVYAMSGEINQTLLGRQQACQHTQTLKQVAVLHSEEHFYRTITSNSVITGETEGVEGAVYALLEGHYGVDILDEWALSECIHEFPMVVAPERHLMSDAMAALLKEYVQKGGSLLVSGAQSYDLFGADFLGAGKGESAYDRNYWLPIDGRTVPLYSGEYRLLTQGEGRWVGNLCETPLFEDHVLNHPAAVIHNVGKGKVAYIPFDIFKYFNKERYPKVRAFVNDVAGMLLPDPMVRVEGPVCVDTVLRQREGEYLLHFINRSSGIPQAPNNGVIDEIPPVGPLTIRLKAEAAPAAVTRLFEDGNVEWSYADGVCSIELDSVRVHEAVSVRR